MKMFYSWNRMNLINPSPNLISVRVCQSQENCITDEKMLAPVVKGQLLISMIPRSELILNDFIALLFPPLRRL